MLKKRPNAGFRRPRSENPDQRDQPWRWKRELFACVQPCKFASFRIDIRMHCFHCELMFVTEFVIATMLYFYSFIYNQPSHHAYTNAARSLLRTLHSIRVSAHYALCFLPRGLRKRCHLPNQPTHYSVIQRKMAICQHPRVSRHGCTVSRGFCCFCFPLFRAPTARRADHAATEKERKKDIWKDSTATAECVCVVKSVRTDFYNPCVCVYIHIPSSRRGVYRRSVKRKSVSNQLIPLIPARWQ